MKIIIDLNISKIGADIEKAIQRMEKMGLFFQKPNYEIIEKLLEAKEYLQAFLLIKSKMNPNNLKISNLENSKMEFELG